MQLNNYSRKYFLEWTDDKGVPHRLDVFQKKGYGGIASEVTCKRPCQGCTES